MLGSEIFSALERLAKAEREEVLAPLEQKVQQELQVLVMRLKVSLGELGVSLGSDLEAVLDRYLDVKRLTNASLASGPGLRRLQDVLDQLRVQLDRELQRNPNFMKNNQSAKQLLELSSRLNLLAHNVFEDFAEVRKEKTVVQHEFKHISAVLESIGSDEEPTHLWEAVVTSQYELQRWLEDVREEFRSISNPRVKVAEQYRGTYLKTWERFIARNFPDMQEIFSKNNLPKKSYSSYEKLFQDYASKEFLTHSLKQLNGWNWNLEPAQPKGVDTSSRQDIRIRKDEIEIDIEIKVVGDFFEIWFQVPSRYVAQIPKALTSILFDLRDAKMDEGISIRGERNPRSGLEAVVLSVPNDIDRANFAELQRFAAEELRRLFP